MTTSSLAYVVHSRLVGGPSPAARKLGGSVVSYVLAFLIVVTLFLTALAAATKNMVSVLLCLTGVATLIALLVTVEARKNYDLFEPFSFIVLSAVIGTALKAPFVALIDSYHVQAHILLGRPLEVLLTGCIYVLIGVSALSAGYLVRTPGIDLSRWGLPRRTVWDHRILTPVLTIALAISAISFLVWFRKMGIEITSLVELSKKRFYTIEGSEFHSSLGYLRWGVSVAESTFYVLLAWRLHAIKRLPFVARIGLPLTFIVAMGFPIFTSSRSGAIEVMLISLMLVHYLKSGIRVRTATTVALIGLGTFALLTGARSARETSQLAERVTFAEIVNSTIGGRHFLDVGKTTQIIDAIPEKVQPTHGTTFLRWITAPVPRTMWANKPTVGSGPILGPAVFNTPQSGVPPGIVAELYLNFGMLGVPIGMFILGIVLRTLYTSFLPYRNNVNVVLLYAVTIIPLSFGLMQNDFSRAIVVVLTEAIPVALLLLAIGRKPKAAVTTG